jgi:hypothetical protein
MGIEYQDLTRAIKEAQLSAQPSLSFMMSFFKKKDTVDTELVEEDSQLKGARVAKIVNPDAVADGTEIPQFTGEIFKLPTIQDKQMITGRDLKKKLKGESVYSQSTPAGKGAIIIKEVIEDQKNKINNKMELLAIDALFNGQVSIIGKGEDRIISFNRDPSLTVDLGAGNYWDEATSDPTADIDDFIELLGNVGSNATHLIGRPSVIRKLISNDEIKAELDNKGIENGELTYQSLANNNGSIYYGKYKELEIWGYNGNYKDDSGNSQKAIPDGKIVVLCADNGNTDMAGYSADIHVESPSLASNKEVAIDNRNFITKISTGDKAIVVEGIQTRCPLLDPTSSLVATVIS